MERQTSFWHVLIAVLYKTWEVAILLYLALVKAWLYTMFSFWHQTLKKVQATWRKSREEQQEEEVWKMTSEEWLKDLSLFSLERKGP